MTFISFILFLIFLVIMACMAFIVFITCIIGILNGGESATVVQMINLEDDNTDVGRTSPE